MRRVTLKDVAREVGISVSCTARALKGRPGISQATTQKVQQVADKLGYRPDPMLSALSSYRESVRSSIGVAESRDGSRSSQLKRD